MGERLTVSEADRDKLINMSLQDSVWEWNIIEKKIVLPKSMGELILQDCSKTIDNSEFYLETVHAEDRENLKLAIKRYFKKEVEALCVEFRIKTKFDEYRWVNLKGNALWDDKGNATYMAGICIDVTENKASDENAEKFKNIFNKVNDMIFLIRINADKTPGKLLEVNDKVCKSLGYRRKELLTKNLLDIIPIYNHEATIYKVKTFIKEKKWTVEDEVIGRNGEVIPVEVNGHIINVEGGLALLAVVRDTTERKRVEKHLLEIMEEKEKLYEKALEYDKLKTDFFSNVSHELRTPLNIILGTVQLLDLMGEKIDNAEIPTHKHCPYRVPKYIRVMKQNCYRLLRLINNLIDLNKMEAGFLTLDLKNYNIVEIVENIVQSVVPYVESKGITLTFDTDIEEKLMAFDLDKMERILLNLISNAVKFILAEGEIIISIEDKQDFISIKVKDNGIGIPEDKIDGLFQRFRQVESPLSKRNEGSGIGLSLVRALVEAHGGTISVNSIYGEGSEFLINIPVNTVDLRDNRIINDVFAQSTKIEKINVEFSDIYEV